MSLSPGQGVVGCVTNKVVRTGSVNLSGQLTVGKTPRTRMFRLRTVINLAACFLAAASVRPPDPTACLPTTDLHEEGQPS